MSNFLRPLLQFFERYYVTIYLVILYLTAGYFLLRHSIQAHDTDMWYHLNGGRYFFTHGFPPTDSFFSFLSPPRERPDYFWLFQVLIYKVHELSGYYGLIVLRAVTYLTLITLVLCYLSRGLDRRQHVYVVMLVALYMMVLLHRYLVIRPHIFSYIFIPAFIYLLERPSRKILLLPLLAVFWCNLHGITYPILLLICGSYTCEYLVACKRYRDMPLKQLSQLSVVLALQAFANGISYADPGLKHRTAVRTGAQVDASRSIAIRR